MARGALCNCATVTPCPDASDSHPRGPVHMEMRPAYSGRRTSCLSSRSTTMVRVWRMPGKLNRKRCRKRS
ncbi:Uncharacterised protein [Bordetella pertussis]|nr:Uncharacterised protein [Bordetella pertussis]